MKRKNLPLVIIIASAILIAINFIFISEDMGLAFWMRILSSLMIILAMYVNIKEQDKEKKSK